MIWLILIILCFLVLALAAFMELAAGFLTPKHIWLLAPIGLLLEIAILIG